MEYIDYLKQPHIINIIQALSSIVLVVITAFYAFLTKKILNAPYKSYLRPIKINIVFNGSSEWSIQVKNFGPSLAVNINIYVIAVNSTSYSKIINQYFNTINRIISTGPLEILSGSEGVYTFIGFINFTFPIEITWESINGEKQKSSWLVNIEDGKDIVLPLTFMKKIILKFKWLRIQFFSPFVFIKKMFLKYFKGEKHL